MFCRVTKSKLNTKIGMANSQCAGSVPDWSVIKALILSADQEKPGPSRLVEVRNNMIAHVQSVAGCVVSHAMAAVNTKHSCVGLYWGVH